MRDPSLVDRRSFTKQSLATVLAATALSTLNSPSTVPAADTVSDAKTLSDAKSLPICDTHQHLWDLKQFKLPWLGEAPEVLKRNYLPADYEQATKGLNVVKAVYMEVDVQADQQNQEADFIMKLCESKSAPTIAAVISGRPNSAGFADYMKRFKGSSIIKGIRQVMHSPDAPKGLCLEPQFVKSIQLLGQMGMSFDLCMRPTELLDAEKLIAKCPDTRFILDHCGNAHPTVFQKGGAPEAKPAHTPDEWKAGIDAIAKHKNVVCKISGIVAFVSKTNDLAGLLAPPINHCLGAFGPDRVMFGGDWPVCLLGSSYAEWVGALKQIVGGRPIAEQRKLFHDNAVAFYRL